MITISDTLSQIIDRLEETDEDTELKLKRILENEFRRRLNRYYLIDRLLKEKYKMGFEQFKAEEIVKKQNYSLDVESDYCDWEMALTGIDSMEKDLSKL